MGRHALAAICLVGTLVAFTGCTTLGPLASTAVGIDGGHGPKGPVIKAVMETLSANGYRPVLIDSPLDKADLNRFGILILSFPVQAYTPAEVDAVERFVSRGGGLLCAAQAWSWTYPEYGNKPNDTFPLNGLGRRLGFRITQHNVGAPAHYKTEIMAGISEVNRNGWWPSSIELSGKDARSIIRDENLNTIGGLLHHGRGRVVIYGHDGILSDNPRLVIQSLDYLARLP